MIDTEKYVKIVSSQTEKPKTAVVEINNQDITITENGVYTASAGYTGIGTATVNVPQPEPVIESISITPTTSEQTITASGGTDGYSPITVSAVTSSIDSNITAGNIKEGVSILGVEGELKPAPVYYIEKTVDANGKAQKGSYLMDFSGITDINDSVFYYAYFNNTNISGVINLSSLTNISGELGCNAMFQGCTGITNVDLSLLTTISGSNACAYMFNNCTNLTSVNLSSLRIVNGPSACSNMFLGCTGLTGVNLSSLTSILASSGCRSMFQGCTNLTSVELSSLASITVGSGCRNMFQGCTSLITLSFPALTSTGFGNYTNQFNGMLTGVTGCTVHFPSNLQSVIGSWADVTAGFDGTNTTVLFDLPATE